MATPSKIPTTEKAPPDEAGGQFAVFAQEDAQDGRALRLAMVGAVIVHLVLFIVHLPEVAAEIRPPAPPKKVYVVQQVRFQQPPATPVTAPPPERRRRVPIPDPTPDEPEPLRFEETETEVDFAPVDDVVIDIPDAPPMVEPETPQGPIEVSGAVTKPIKIYAPDPQYTEIARKARIQGVVIVQAIIDKEGKVVGVKVLKGLPMGLTESAVAAMKQWTFKAATLSGKPVDVYYNLTVNFQLQ